MIVGHKAANAVSFSPLELATWMRAFSLLVVVAAFVVTLANPNVLAQEQVGPELKMALIGFGTESSPMEIKPFSEAYLERKLIRAQQLGVNLIVLEIDSPGGLLEEGMRMANRLRDIDWAKTVAYVPRQALSAGSFLCLACDEVVIGDNAFMGDAGPIYMDEYFMFRHVEEKVRSDLAAKIRKLAESSGRPPALAEAMVDQNLEVFRVVHADDGRVSYMSDAELNALEDPTEWTKGPPVQESAVGKFLEVSGSVATELGLADAVINSRAELAARYQLAPEDVINLESTWVDTLVIVLNYRSVTILLFIIGLIAAYVEFAAPGISVGGLISGLCFGCFFWSRFLGGTAGWLEVLLFAAGICFLIVELFVIPGFGVAGFGGLLLIVTSLVMASERWSGSDGVSLNHVLASLLSVCLGGVGSMVGMWVASRYVGGLKMFRHLTLEPPPTNVGGPGVATDSASESKVATPISLVVGAEGIADSILRPAGRAVFDGKYFDVVTDGSYVEAGSRVRVIKVQGSQVTVRQV